MKKSEVNKKRILLVYTGITTTTDILKSVLKKVATKCGSKLVAKDSCLITRGDITLADVIIFSRGADPYMAKIAKAAEIAGHFCILYLDDDLYTYNKDNCYGEALIECLNNCNVLWVSNPLIAEKYSKYNPQIKRVETKLYEEISFVRSPLAKDGETCILYAGSPAHANVLQEIIVPAFNKLNEDLSFRVVFAGFERGTLSNCHFKAKYIPWMSDVSSYRRAVAEENAHIGIGIIPDTEFGNCKYYNKWLEYTKLGIAGIFSDVTPYRLIVENGVNGCLTKNTVTDWAEAIEQLVINEQKRLSIANNAQKTLKDEFIDFDIVSTIVELIPEFEDFHAGTAKVMYGSDKLLGMARAIWHKIRR